jgi:predicted nucleic acid-binding protein
MILLDTNILIFAKQVNHPEHITVSQKLLQHIQNGEALIVSPQGMYEFYVVVTRPKVQRGFGLSSHQALNEIDDLQISYTFLDDSADLFVRWQHLIQQYGTIGKAAHDARWVAFMIAHGIDTIYTDNAKDFNRYNNIISILT